MTEPNPEAPVALDSLLDALGAGFIAIACMEERGLANGRHERVSVGFRQLTLEMSKSEPIM